MTPATSLTLPLEQRVRSRLRVTLDDGSEAGLFLERGQVLRDGDLVASDDGLVVQVRAAPEPLSSVYCDDALQLARVCYHLGNRHVPLEINAGRVRYQHDHVLDDLVRGLGLEAVLEHAPFEPEPGAYGGARHPHGHEHRH
jgi:urease accessory protein